MFNRLGWVLSEEVSLLKQEKLTGHLINRSGLPASFPTHAHEPALWEALGRAVATFGFLQEMLLRAIFALTVTTPYVESEIELVYNMWVAKITRSLSDPLGNLIDKYGSAVRDHPNTKIDDFDTLLADLREACKIRNAICHGSWRKPDSEGLSVLFYVNRQDEIFDTPIGVAFLEQLQRSTMDLACSVIDTVTHMGWQFPGSNGPGHVVWPQSSG
jgi:hypothetical protein